MLNQDVDPRETSLAERYFTEPAIDRRLPEHGREPRTALEMVQSEMLLDGDPAKNLATFVTTWMEPEARQVSVDNLHRNFIDHAEYPAHGRGGQALRAHSPRPVRDTIADLRKRAAGEHTRKRVHRGHGY